MFDYIKGSLVSHKNLPSGCFITIDVNGIGYLLKVTERAYNQLPENNSDMQIFISLIHREDSMFLCGFLNKEERDLFEILQTVSGVGVKAALTIIDEFTITELMGIMINEDYKELSRAKGIGQKSAQKIVIELKDKLLARQDYLVTKTDVKVNNEPQCTIEVRNVLFSLGYSKEEIDNALNFVLSIANIKLETEEILKKSLQYLAQQ
ncbi:Holliday junction branch migration protein RuvA [bacterium]|nr:Holliday junction branch migration protein RuvA [bacterium]